MEGDLLSEEEELREQSEDLDLRCTSVYQGGVHSCTSRSNTQLHIRVEYTAVHQGEHRIAGGHRICIHISIFGESS
jgi:hypothetical protein